MLQWSDDHTVHARVLELVRYLGCLPLAIGLASSHARVHGTSSPAKFLAEIKRLAQSSHEQLEVGAKVELHPYFELHSQNATEHNRKQGELLEYHTEAHQ